MPGFILCIIAWSSCITADQLEGMSMLPTVAAAEAFRDELTGSLRNHFSDKCSQARLLLLGCLSVKAQQGA